LVIFLIIALLLLIGTVTPKGRDLMKKAGVSDYAIGIIQKVSIVLIIILVAVLAFLLAPLLGGILATLLTIFGVVMLLAGLAYIYNLISKPNTITVNDNSTPGEAQSVAPDAGEYGQSPNASQG
jgi:predicted phage tail protein